MNNSIKENTVSAINNEVTNESQIVKTDVGNTNGQTKCPKCGSTDIQTNTNNGHLRCNFCRHEFEPEKIVGMETNIQNLEGQVLASGAQNIIADTNDIMTFKCSSCGAEVVINTASSTQARCHWCRNTLSVNQQIPNGSIPDVVLPFITKQEEAKMKIEEFVGKRKFYSHPNFKKEFTTDNIMGVFFPYMVVDVNSHAKFIVQGEQLKRRYTKGSGENAKTYYDADLYNVVRDFDLTINGLTIESNSDRLNKNSSDKTNNIINSIMPFDIENCVKYDANYIKGYTSEKRDTNIEDLKKIVDNQSKDIARFAANDTLKQYDRGVVWSNEIMEVKGQQWKAAYLPVWLYSYQQVKGDKKILHYVAVNARTKETMGSVPIYIPKLLFISSLIEIFGIILMLFIDWDYSWIFTLSGILYYLLIYSKYRNSGARHTYETETKKQIINLKKEDNFVGQRTNLTDSMIDGCNNTRISGETLGNTILNSVLDANPLGKIIEDNIIKKEGK